MGTYFFSLSLDMVIVARDGFLLRPFAEDMAINVT